MIPVLGVPILVRPDLLYAMLASINVPVGKIVVIDNGNVVDPARVDGEVIKPGTNLGVAGSWNRIITDYPAPWWCISNFDLTFGPNDLANLTHRMEQVGGLAMLGDFSCFGVDAPTIERVGIFDGNLVPAYFEDNDFDYRCRLTHTPMVALPFGMKHDRSSTIRNSTLYRSENSRTFPENAAYYLAKWGGPPWAEIFTTPFNRGGDIREWTLDEERHARQQWAMEP